MPGIVVFGDSSYMVAADRESGETMTYSIRRGIPPNTRTTMRLTTRDTVEQARALIAEGDLEFRIFTSRGEPVELQALEQALDSLPDRA